MEWWGGLSELMSYSSSLQGVVEPYSSSLKANERHVLFHELNPQCLESLHSRLWSKP